MYATIATTPKTKGYQHFMFITYTVPHCGIMWKVTECFKKRGKLGNLQIHKTCALVAWQGENGGVHIGTDMLFVELLIQALHSSLGGVVVLAEVTQHDVFHARMIGLRHKSRRLLIAQMAKRPCDALLQDVGV